VKNLQLAVQEAVAERRRRGLPVAVLADGMVTVGE
jgi:hypothetical protein